MLVMNSNIVIFDATGATYTNKITKMGAGNCFNLSLLLATGQAYIGAPVFTKLTFSSGRVVYLSTADINDAVNSDPFMWQDGEAFFVFDMALLPVQLVDANLFYREGVN